MFARMSRPTASDATKKPAQAVQRKAEGALSGTASPPIVRDVVRESGQPLEPRTRAFLESRFAHDFSRVRVHTEARAAEAARALRARAYTQGEHIVFAGGRYRPGTAEGLRLVGHELAHVVQQSTGRVASSGTKASIVTSSRLEREADLAGDQVARGQFVNGRGSPPPGEAAQLDAPGMPIQLDSDSEDFKQGYERGLSGRESAAGPLDTNSLVDYQEGYAKGRYEFTQRTASRASADVSSQPSSSRVLPPASDAVSGIHIEFLTPPLPRAEGTLTGSNFKKGSYLFAPNLRDRDTGSPKVVYYIAYRTDAKRNEYVIGPDSLDLFTSNLDTFKTIGDTAYADPDVIDYIIGFGDAVWDQQGDIVTQYFRWLHLSDMAAIHAEMVRVGKEIRDEQRTRQQQQAKATVAAKVLPLINAAMVAAAGARLLAGARGAPPGGGAKPPTVKPSGPQPPAANAADPVVPRAEPAAEAPATRPQGTDARTPKAPETAPAATTAPPTKPPVVEGEAPTSGPDLFKKTAQAPGGQTEKASFFEKNVEILKQRTGWAANRTGEATDGSIVYHGEAQSKAFVITREGRVFTGTWTEHVKFQVGPSGPQLVCDWTLPGWKQW